MLHFLPPAGTPLSLSHLAAATASVFGAQQRRAEGLPWFARQFRTPHVLAANSGRTALWAVLRGLHALRPGRRVVVVPAYTCFSVAAAVVRAGFQLHPVDVAEEGFDYDPAQLQAIPEDTLCILTANLFGFVDDAERAQHIARAKGAFLVDDAAQALGAVRNGRLAGTAGDVGIFSLARGKALPAGEGGLVATRADEIAAAVRAELDSLPEPSMAHNAAVWLRAAAGSILLHPRFYWLPNALPFLKLGVTEYNPGFPATRASRVTLELLARMAPRLEELNRTRAANAARLTAALEGNELFRPLSPPVGCQPSYIRLPVLARDAALREEALRRLRAAGIGASGYYPSPISEIPGIEPHLVRRNTYPNAAALAARLLTLPTHPLVRPGDVERIAAVLRTLAGEARAQAPAAPVAVGGSRFDTHTGPA